MRARRPLCAALLFIGVLLAAAPGQAEEVIRYKPILVQSGDNNLANPKVLIVDTKDGHVWLWQERGRKEAADGSAESQIVYQGKVTPARAAGEVVASSKGRR